MKQKLRFHTVEAVDREIARMEDTLAHTSMPLSEEKKMVVAIKDLSKSRETVKEYGEMQSKISGEDGSRKAIIERLRAKDAEINAVKAEQQRIRGELDATRSKGDEVGADIPKMQEERNACYEVIKGKREEIRGLRAAHKKAEDEYWTREKLWRAYLKQEKQKQWEASVKEREAREEARKQWERENAPEPFEAEVTAADQLVAYLAKWDPASSEKDDAAAAAAKAAEAAAAAETAKAFEGLQLMGKKNKNDDDDDLFSLSGTSKGKKAKRAGKSAAKSAETGGGSQPERTSQHLLRRLRVLLEALPRGALHRGRGARDARVAAREEGGAAGEAPREEGTHRRGSGRRGREGEEGGGEGGQGEEGKEEREGEEGGEEAWRRLRHARGGRRRGRRRHRRGRFGGVSGRRGARGVFFGENNERFFGENNERTIKPRLRRVELPARYQHGRVRADGLS